MARSKDGGRIPTRSALVVGGAACVWDDLSIALREYQPDAVFVVNDIGTVYDDRIDFWCTLHPEKMLDWQQLRKEHGLNTDYITYAHEPWRSPTPGEPEPRIDKVIDYRYPGMTGSGSSGLLAVKCAQAEGYNRIVLAGVPLQTEQKHFFDGNLWVERDQFAAAWDIAWPFLNGEVRSLSGWTRHKLGAPTPTWFAGGDQ
jgi:hypothetical protein